MAEGRRSDLLLATYSSPLFAPSLTSASRVGAFFVTDAFFAFRFGLALGAAGVSSKAGLPSFTIT